MSHPIITGLCLLLLCNPASAAELPPPPAIPQAIAILRLARDQARDAREAELLSQAVASLERLLVDAAVSTAAAVEIATLEREYKANAVAADNKYKGRVFPVTGVVQKLEREVSIGMYYLVLMPTAGRPHRSDCRFFFASDDQMAKLEPGTRVTIVGKCNGYDLDVVFTNCRVR